MQELNQFLENENRRKTIKLNTNIMNQNLEESKKKLQIKFDKWFTNLKELFSSKLYRQVLREIEEKKYKYNLILSTHGWKLNILKAKAILKIIKRKMQKHHKEIILENSIQQFSLKFWINQIYITLEELFLEFRFDLNPHVDQHSKIVLKSVQIITETYLELLYYLSIFSIQTGETIALLTYISNADKFMKFINILVNPNIYELLEELVLIKIKLLIENCNFIPALDNLEIFFNIFFKDIKFHLDFESPIGSEEINSSRKEDKKRNLGISNAVLKIIMAYYLRGVISEHLGLYKNSIKAYQQCRWFSNIFLINNNKPAFKYFRNIEKIFLIFKEVFKDIQEQYENKDNRKSLLNKSNSKIIFFEKKGNMNKPSENNNKTRNMKLSNAKKENKSKSKDKNQLVKFLDNIGQHLYKEEENRSINVFNQFGPSKFVLSTVDMVNNLLSQPFRDILKKMDKIEVTKPQENISYLINKTLTMKRREEFREQLIQKIINKNKKKIHVIKVNKNSSTNLSSILSQNFNSLNVPNTQKINLIPLYINNEKKQKENNRYDYITTKVIKTKLCSSTRTKSQSMSKKVRRNDYKTIFKFSPDNDVFSKSMISKKQHLDSFFEKELVFQKKLLKLKSYDMEVVRADDYNQQQVIRKAEQDFNIIKCFAESKNAKKNLMNLVGVSELKNWEYMMKNKSRTRTNRKLHILNINSLNNFMKMNHISQTRIKFNPDEASKNNDEKIKSLMVECSKLEELQNKCKMQKDILRNKILGIKQENYNTYKIN